MYLNILTKREQIMKLSLEDKVTLMGVLLPVKKQLKKDEFNAQINALHSGTTIDQEPTRKLDAVNNLFVQLAKPELSYEKN